MCLLLFHPIKVKGNLEPKPKAFSSHFIFPSLSLSHYDYTALLLLSALLRKKRRIADSTRLDSTLLHFNFTHLEAEVCWLLEGAAIIANYIMRWLVGGMEVVMGEVKLNSACFYYPRCKI